MMLDAFGPGIWLAPGGAAQAFGFRYPTRMAVIRLADGGLLLWSPVALTPALHGAVSDLGPVRQIVAPNHLHHLSLGDWIAAYPVASVHGAPGLAAKRPDITFDTELGDTPPVDWRPGLDMALIRGNAITTEAVLFHRASATVLVCDLLQQFDDDWFHGWRRIIARLDRMVSPAPAMPRKFRLAFVRPQAARPGITRVLDWPAERLVVAHGQPLMQGAAALLRSEFRGLVG